MAGRPGRLVPARRLSPALLAAAAAVLAALAALAAAPGALATPYFDCTGNPYIEFGDKNSAGPFYDVR